MIRSKFDNSDQRMHIDGWNHTLVVPTDWYHPSSVAMIVYLSDVDDTGGATALVARQGPDDVAYAESVEQTFLRTPGAGALPWINDRESAEEYIRQHASPEVASFRESLYGREAYAQFRRGTVLLYRHDVWHRGTPLTIAGSMRLVVNLSYRRADAAEWFQHWNAGWAKCMYSPTMQLEKLVARASVFQRTVLGFPRPGHRYWTRRTLDGVKARYEALGFDVTPYEEAFVVGDDGGTNRHAMTSQ